MILNFLLIDKNNSSLFSIMNPISFPNCMTFYLWPFLILLFINRFYDKVVFNVSLIDNDHTLLIQFSYDWHLCCRMSKFFNVLFIFWSRHILILLFVLSIFFISFNVAIITWCWFFCLFFRLFFLIFQFWWLYFLWLRLLFNLLILLFRNIQFTWTCLLRSLA